GDWQLATLKVADFGLGGVAAALAARSRIGTTTADYLSLADQASLFRGAGTPLYMSPEQRRGSPPDPRHDLFALGVVWFQLLAGDVSRELHPGWAKELTVKFGVPPSHIAVIERCVGWFEERPKDAGELLELLHQMPDAPAVPRPVPVEPVPAKPPAETVRNASSETSIGFDWVDPVKAIIADPTRKAAFVHYLRAFDKTIAATHQSEDQARVGATVFGIVFGVLGLLGFALPMSLQRILHPLLAVFLGLVITTIVAVSCWQLYRAAIRSYRRARADAVAKFTQTYPEVAERCGGNAVLSQAAFVRSILNAVDDAPKPTFWGRMFGRR
ncbi:MAG TPA: hypothetical protein VMZ71_05320, partial [Gemmataceae bacterium]|nr:hypothetical protein [Gemmataceae bacterium]